jgi:predicted HicB family RNase H-like nuclease
MKDVMTYEGFIGSVHFSGDDRVFFGKVEGINDLITFEGQTVDELEQAFKYMVDEHIKDCEKNNTPLEKSYRGSLNIRLAPELHKRAVYNATIKGISLNQYINEAVKKLTSNESASTVS